jgi:tRNA(Arg) A34 adenosine deaminase TadA
LVARGPWEYKYVPNPRHYNAQSAETASPIQLALEEAGRAAARGEVPVGAVVTAADGAILARAGNQTEAAKDASAHAEMIAMREAASSLGATRLAGCDLWVTLEPCPMCAAAASLFRVRRLVFGAYDPKGGGVEHGPRIFQAPGCLHVPEVVGGVRETESAALLKAFFLARR